jgi:hypothetical protein
VCDLETSRICATHTHTHTYIYIYDISTLRVNVEVLSLNLGQDTGCTDKVSISALKQILG